MATVAAAIATAFIFVLLIKLFINYLKDLEFSRKYATPSLPLPLLGHSHLFFGVNREDIVDTLMELMKVDHTGRKMGSIMGQRAIWYYHPEPVEEILSSNEHITKSQEYDYLEVGFVLMYVR